MMMKTTTQLPKETFKEAYLRLDASFDFIPKYLEQKSPEETPASHLGFTEEEYQLYLEKPYHLEYKLSLERGIHRVGDYVEGMTKQGQFVRGWIVSIESSLPYKQYLIESDHAFANEKGYELEDTVLISSEYGYLAKSPYKQKPNL